MSGIIDYIKWRGDISFKESPFNEVDNLIFTQFSSIDFKGIVPEDTVDPIPLHVAVRTVIDRGRAASMKLGLIVPDIIYTLAALMAESKRYGDLMLCSHVCRFDLEQEGQFSAITAIIDEKTACVVFRGTDDTLIGWKEDFNLAFNSDVPSHAMSSEYLEETVSKLNRQVYVCGHSKGGHLAIYSSATASMGIQDKILKVYSNDGPGFPIEFFKTEGYIRVSDRVVTVVPQGGFIGRIFNQDEKTYRIVRSTNSGIYQHDGFSWQVLGKSFIGDSFTAECERNQKTFNSWISEMSNEDKKAFVDKFFAFLGSSGAKTLLELTENPPQLIKAYKELSDEDKALIKKALRLLLSKGGKTISESLPKIPKSSIDIPIKITVTTTTSEESKDKKQERKKK